MAFVVTSGLGCLRRSLPHKSTTSSTSSSNFTKFHYQQSHRRAFRTSIPTMVNKGDKVPSDIDLMELKDGKPSPISVSSIFSGKKVALFTLPGALTPTCQDSHVKDWLAAMDDVKAKGIDTIACISVNDPFVMNVFAEKTQAKDKIEFYADGGALFTKAVGIDVDTGGFGGIRAKRGSYVVDDGTFVQVNIEEKNTNYDGPAKPDTVLSQL